MEVISVNKLKTQLFSYLISITLIFASVTEVTAYPDSSSFEFFGTSAVLKWSKCPEESNSCPTWTKNWPIDVEFSECTRSPECSIIQVGICESVNNPIICQSNNNGSEVSFRYINVSRSSG